jgi:hypothetical protein
VAIAPVVIEDQSKVIRERPEGQHRGVIDPWSAMHQDQWIPLSDDVYEQ